MIKYTLLLIALRFNIPLLCSFHSPSLLITNYTY